MKLSLVLQAIDRMSGPTKAAGRSIDALGRGAFAGLSSRVQRARSDFRAFASDTDRVEAASVRLGRSIRAVAERDFAALRRGAERTRLVMRGLATESARWAGRAAGTTIRWGAIGVAGGAAAGAGLFARGVISNAAKFEQYQVALEGTEGSAAKAKAAMQWVQKFAKDTPYDIDTVTDSFVRARGVGIDPMTGSLRILGDAAGGTRKSLMDAVEAIADAQTGEFERLKEFNIVSSSKGPTVTFSYIDKAGKQASVSVKKSMTEIRGAVLKVFDAKYGGGMERQSKTLLGIWNNLGDVVTNFELSVAGKGIFDRVKGKLQSVLDYTDRLAKDGSLDRWAQNVSDKMGEMFDGAERFVREVDWRSVASGIGTIASALTTVVGWIGKASSAWSTWQYDVQRRQLQMTIDDGGGWFGGAAKVADARRRMSQLDADHFGQSQATMVGGRVQWPATGGQRRPLRHFAPMTREETWRRAFNRSGASGLGPMRGAPSRGPLKSRSVVDLRISGTGASAVKVGRISAADGTELNVTRGFAMGGPA